MPVSPPALLLSSALVVLAAAPAAGAECIVYRHSAEFNAEQVVQMMVSSGKDCRVQYPLPAGKEIDTNEITTHPRYGGARVHGASGAYYRSNPGYRGPDRFAFAFCDRAEARSSCARVTVKVEVR